MEHFLHIWEMYELNKSKTHQVCGELLFLKKPKKVKHGPTYLRVLICLETGNLIRFNVLHVDVVAGESCYLDNQELWFPSKYFESKSQNEETWAQPSFKMIKIHFRGFSFGSYQKFL